MGIYLHLDGDISLEWRRERRHLMDPEHVADRRPAVFDQAGKLCEEHEVCSHPLTPVSVRLEASWALRRRPLALRSSAVELALGAARLRPCGSRCSRAERPE